MAQPGASCLMPFHLTPGWKFRGSKIQWCNYYYVFKDGFIGKFVWVAKTFFVCNHCRQASLPTYASSKMPAYGLVPISIPFSYLIWCNCILTLVRSFSNCRCRVNVMKVSPFSLSRWKKVQCESAQQTANLSHYQTCTGKIWTREAKSWKVQSTWSPKKSIFFLLCAHNKNFLAYTSYFLVCAG